MRTVDAIAEILKREGVEYLSCFPTTPMIEAAAQAASVPSSAARSEWGLALPTVLAA